MTTDVPTPKTLDLGAFLAGQNHPTEVVEVFMAEDVMYSLARANEAIRKAEVRGETEAIAELEARRDELVEAGISSRLEVHLQGISKKTEKDIERKVIAEHPVDTDLLGRPKPNFERTEALANLFWAAYITKIVAPDGSALVAPGLEDIQNLRDNAPEPAINAIEAAINEFTTGSKSGFESLVQEHGFLSQPSPEA